MNIKYIYGGWYDSSFRFPGSLCISQIYGSKIYEPHDRYDMLSARGICDHFKLIKTI